MRLQSAVIIILSVILSGIILFINLQLSNINPFIQPSPHPSGTIRYLPIGDSYTIGNGVKAEDRWPNILVKHLNKTGVQIQLIGNPAVSGFTVKDAIEYELPKVKDLQPDFVTVLIGANDNFRQTNPSVYEQDLSLFLDQLQNMMKNPQSIVLITIPDYSYSPAARDYNKDGISESIAQYNQIIKSQGQKRGLKVADIYPVSQSMTGAEDFISDGLHPSAAGYRKWEEVIYPVVFEVLE